MTSPLAAVVQYHEATKHHPRRYARSLGYLDWATQPDPFRRYLGAPTIPLMLAPADSGPSYDDLFRPGVIPTRPVSWETISEFLQYSLALSAWKEFRGSRWALRINPSSGNLHPTEGYLVMGKVPGLTAEPGLFHYAPKDHLLEQRCSIQQSDWQQLAAAFPPATFFAGLSSIHWREAWKYGERAYRYCQHDAGHALAALAFSAAIQGWTVYPLSGWSDDGLNTLLGLDREPDFEGAEREQGDLLMAVVPGTAGSLPGGFTDIIPTIRGDWFGKANRLSSDHVHWEVIDAVVAACAKPATRHAVPPSGPQPSPLDPKRPPAPARQVIFQRRSAVAMDGRTALTAEQFYLLLDRVLPRCDRTPWTGLGSPAYVHLAVVVHLIDDLEPGLYFLVRSPAALAQLRPATRSEFVWRRPAGCPDSLPLYHLRSGDTRGLAGHVSCGQEIAADGAFSLGMIAEFEEPLNNLGAWAYRRLFWETGVIGQVLYLEAEAAGIRSTGIGCFFDDTMHEVLGLRGTRFQSLYHFTVGGPVEDGRLTALPPYPPEFSRRKAARTANE